MQKLPVKLQVKKSVCDPKLYYQNHGLTDHAVLLAGDIAVINMMTQGNGRTNNAWSNPNTDTGSIIWSTPESDLEYQERLSRWLVFFKKLKQEGVSILIVSEAPLEQPCFWDEVLRMSFMFSEKHRTGLHRFCHTVWVDAEKYAQITDKTASVREKISPGNQDRFVLVALESHKGASLEVFGIHGNFKAQAGTVADVKRALKWGVALGGDLNVSFNHPELQRLQDKYQSLGGVVKAPFHFSVDALYRGDLL